MSDIRFQEVQRFRRTWVWLAVIAIDLLFVYAIVQQVVMGKAFGNRPVSDNMLILMSFIPVLLLIFLLTIKLTTRIDETGIHYRFTPFQFKTTTIGWNELRDAYIREYNSLYEYGGWGIRIGAEKTGRAINTSASCRKGLQLQFTDGKLLLIGTRKPAELETIIHEIMVKGLINRGI